MQCLTSRHQAPHLSAHTCKQPSPAYTHTVNKLYGRICFMADFYGSKPRKPYSFLSLHVSAGWAEARSDWTSCNRAYVVAARSSGPMNANDIVMNNWCRNLHIFFGKKAIRARYMLLATFWKRDHRRLGNNKWQSHDRCTDYLQTCFDVFVQFESTVCVYICGWMRTDNFGIWRRINVTAEIETASFSWFCFDSSDATADFIRKLKHDLTFSFILWMSSITSKYDF